MNVSYPLQLLCTELKYPAPQWALETQNHSTSSVELSLWEKNTELLQTDQFYTFTNLSTKNYRGNTTLTTTHQTTITPLHRPISLAPENASVTQQTPHSILTKFVKGHCDLTTIDAQDIDEFLLTAGPVTKKHNDEKQIWLLPNPAVSNPKTHCRSCQLFPATAEDTPLSSTFQQNTLQTQ